MSVVVARSAGFCWGVRRAVDLVLAELKKGRGPFRVYGPLVHNPLVLEALAEKGVEICADPSGAEGGILFLRTHGTTLEERAGLESLPVRLRDLTCPRVGRALSVARSRHASGFTVIILGDEGHQEVRALRSFAGGDDALVISGPSDVSGLPSVDRPFLLSQTTQDSDAFERTVEALRERFPDLQWENTICGSTGERQAELRDLCPKVDCVVVVGGRESANTARLTSIAAEHGLCAIQVESADELDPSELRGHRKILLTAGASTPSWAIRSVLGRLLEIQGARVGAAFAALRRLVFSNMHMLLAALAIGLAGDLVVGNGLWILPAVSAALILFALQNINTLLEAGSAGTESEERQAFVRRSRTLLTVVSFSALAGAMAVSTAVDPLFGLFYAGSLLLFVIYSIPLLRRTAFPPGGLRAVPGSRDILFALGWAFLLSALPALVAGADSSPWGVAAWSLQLFVLFLGRSLMLDLVDLQGDALMGRDTIPLSLGKERSRTLLWALVSIPPVVLLTAAVLRVLPIAALGALAGHAWLAAGYLRTSRIPFPSELAARAAGDGSLLAAGLGPLLVRLVSGAA